MKQLRNRKEYFKYYNEIEDFKKDILIRESVYNLAGEIICEKEYNDEGELTEKVENVYDEKGRLVNTSYERDEDNVKQNTRFYYEKDLLIKSEEIYSTGGSVINNYEYNKEGNVILFSKIDENNELIEETKFEYSKEGFDVIETRFDENDEIITIKKIQKDCYGNICLELVDYYNEEGIYHSNKFESKSLDKDVTLEQKIYVNDELIEIRRNKFDANEEVVSLKIEFPEESKIIEEFYNEDEENRMEEKITKENGEEIEIRYIYSDENDWSIKSKYLIKMDELHFIEHNYFYLNEYYE